MVRRRCGHRGLRYEGRHWRGRMSRTFTAQEGARTHKISMQLEIEDVAELVTVIIRM